MCVLQETQCCDKYSVIVDNKAGNSQHCNEVHIQGLRQAQPDGNDYTPLAMLAESCRSIAKIRAITVREILDDHLE